MRLWRDILIACLVITLIAIVSHYIDKRIGSKLTRNCIIIDDLTAQQLMAPVTGLYLIMAKLFPIVNSHLSGHWSVVVETPKGFFNISTARYMSVYIYRLFKDGSFYFNSCRWEDKLYILKKYSLKDEYKDRPVTVYDIAHSAMEFYNKNDMLAYSMINHNCQHVAQYIINTFGRVDKDDKLMLSFKGLQLMSRAVSDALCGPKILF